MTALAGLVIACSALVSIAPWRSGDREPAVGDSLAVAPHPQRGPALGAGLLTGGPLALCGLGDLGSGHLVDLLAEDLQMLRRERGGELDEVALGCLGLVTGHAVGTVLRQPLDRALDDLGLVERHLAGEHPGLEVPVAAQQVGEPEGGELRLHLRQRGEGGDLLRRRHRPHRRTPDHLVEPLREPLRQHRQRGVSTRSGVAARVSVVTQVKQRPPTTARSLTCPYLNSWTHIRTCHRARRACLTYLSTAQAMRESNRRMSAPLPTLILM